MPTAVPNPSSSSGPPRRPAQAEPARAARPAAPRQAAQQQHTSSSSASASSSSRLPAAPSSLRVQMPSNATPSQPTPRSPPSSSRPTRPSNESDLLTSVLIRRRPSQTIPAVPPPAASTSTSTTTPAPATQPPVPSDVSLLASSLLSQRAKSQAIAAAQEYLIFPPTTSPSGARTREELKRSLTRLAVPHWLQVNQERSLAGLCGYPSCPKPLPAQTAQRSSGGARLRISVARGVIERDTRDEPGGRNGFCSDVCHARGEWVRRWVLSDEGDGDTDEGPRRRGAATAGQEDAAQQSSSFFSGDDLVDGLRASIASGSSARGAGDGGLRALGTPSALQGGKWEALTRRKEEDWREIELLEDLQERGDLEEWEGFEADGEEGEEDDTVASEAAAAADRSFQAVTASSAAPPPSEEPAVAAATALARDANSLPFDDLVISERQHAAPPTVEEERAQVQAAAAAAAAEEEDKESEDEEEEEMSEEQKMIEEAMRLREEIKGRGEWVE